MLSTENTIEAAEDVVHILLFESIFQYIETALLLFQKHSLFDCQMKTAVQVVVTGFMSVLYCSLKVIVRSFEDILFLF